MATRCRRGGQREAADLQGAIAACSTVLCSAAPVVLSLLRPCCASSFASALISVRCCVLCSAGVQIRSQTALCPRSSLHSPRDEHTHTHATAHSTHALTQHDNMRRNTVSNAVRHSGGAHAQSGATDRSRATGAGRQLTQRSPVPELWRVRCTPLCAAPVAGIVRMCERRRRPRRRRFHAHRSGGIASAS